MYTPTPGALFPVELVDGGGDSNARPPPRDPFTIITITAMATTRESFHRHAPAGRRRFWTLETVKLKTDMTKQQLKDAT